MVQQKSRILSPQTILNNYYKILLILYLPLFIWSAINPKIYLLWLAEITPVIIGISLFLFFNSTIQFSRTTYSWCFFAACLITFGAHYSYSEVPISNWIQEISNGDRNNFDRFGHVVQGIIPVLICYEIFVQLKVVKGIFWINLLSFTVAMTISSTYEIAEWLIMASWDSNVTIEFLGAQGDIWDAQWDMLAAASGAFFTILFGQKHLKSLFRSVN